MEKQKEVHTQYAIKKDEIRKMFEIEGYIMKIEYNDKNQELIIITKKPISDK